MRTDLASGDLAAEIAPYDALIIRSATQVTDEVLAAAPQPEGGRARRDRPGQRRRRGRHAPRRDGGQRAAVQHHQRRRAGDGVAAGAGPQHAAGPRRAEGRARGSVREWEGVELAGKTIGLVGLGRVGALVAQRAAGFGMRVIAFDPYVSAERAKEMGVDAMPSLEALLVQADFVSIHLPRTPETEGLHRRARAAR